MFFGVSHIVLQVSHLKRAEDLWSGRMGFAVSKRGHAIILWRTLTEDEWGFVPDIPKQGEWYPEAEQLLKRLLSHVPALFRMLARRKTTRVIELLAAELKSPVTTEIVIKGYITASAKVTRFRLIAPLKAEGIDPEKYREEFDYE